MAFTERIKEGIETILNPPTNSSNSEGGITRREFLLEAAVVSAGLLIRWGKEKRRIELPTLELGEEVEISSNYNISSFSAASGGQEELFALLENVYYGSTHLHFLIEDQEGIKEVAYGRLIDYENGWRCFATCPPVIVCEGGNIFRAFVFGNNPQSSSYEIVSRRIKLRPGGGMEYLGNIETFIGELPQIYNLTGLINPTTSDLLLVWRDQQQTIKGKIKSGEILRDFPEIGRCFEHSNSRPLSICPFNEGYVSSFIKGKGEWLEFDRKLIFRYHDRNGRVISSLELFQDRIFGSDIFPLEGNKAFIVWSVRGIDDVGKIFLQMLEIGSQIKPIGEPVLITGEKNHLFLYPKIGGFKDLNQKECLLVYYNNYYNLYRYWTEAVPLLGSTFGLITQVGDKSDFTSILPDKDGWLLFYLKKPYNPYYGGICARKARLNIRQLGNQIFLPVINK